MKPALRDQQPTFAWPIDKAMLLRDPPRPPARQRTAQRLRLAGAIKRRARAFLDESVEPGEQLGIGRLPVQVILPCLFVENELHSASSRSVPLPSSRSLTALSSRSALRGFRSR